MQVFRGDVVDIGNDTMMVQTTGKPDKVDAFVRLLSAFRQDQRVARYATPDEAGSDGDSTEGFS